MAYDSGHVCDQRAAENIEVKDIIEGGTGLEGVPRPIVLERDGVLREAVIPEMAELAHGPFPAMHVEAALPQPVHEPIV